MRKRFLAGVSLLLVLLTGCFGDKEKDTEKPTQKPTVPIITTEGAVTVSTAAPVTVNVSENFDVDTLSGPNITSPGAFFSALSSLKGTSGSKAVDSLIEAAVIFNGIEKEEIGELLGGTFDSINGEEYSTEGGIQYSKRSIEVLGHIVKRVAPTKAGEVEEVKEINEADVQRMIKESVIPRLDTVISKMKIAVEANENLVIPKKYTDNYNVIITPAHLLFAESYVKMLRGWCHYLVSYNLDAGFKSMENVEWPEDTFVPKMGDYMSSQIDPLFLTVKDIEAAKKAKKDMIEGMAEMQNAVLNMPIAEWGTLSSDYSTFTPNKDFDMLACPNILGVPTSVKSAINKEMNTFIASMNGPVEFSYMVEGKKIKARVYLGALFGMNIRATAVGVMNHFSNSKDLNKQDIAGLAVETVGGLIPDGVKSVMDSVAPGSWEDMIDDYADFNKAETYTAGEIPFGNIEMYGDEGVEALIKAGKEGVLKLTINESSSVDARIVSKMPETGAYGNYYTNKLYLKVAKDDLILIDGYSYNVKGIQVTGFIDDKMEDEVLTLTADTGTITASAIEVEKVYRIAFEGEGIFTSEVINYGGGWNFWDSNINRADSIALANVGYIQKTQYSHDFDYKIYRKSDAENKKIGEVINKRGLYKVSITEPGEYKMVYFGNDLYYTEGTIQMFDNQLSCVQPKHSGNDENYWYSDNDSVIRLSSYGKNKVELGTGEYYIYYEGEYFGEDKSFFLTKY